jgi:hypothetical protein
VPGIGEDGRTVGADVAADVIRMAVGQDDRVDLRWLDPRCAEVAEQLAHGRRQVARPRVDQDEV